MSKLTKIKSLSIVLLMIALLSPLPLSADDLTEEVGIGIGITAGNMWFVPVKAISFFWGLTEGTLSFILTGGNTELTQQIWEDTTQGPYLITPEVARTAIGERPELEQK
ncbi:MAG: hypothetical protein ACE5JO_09420 [Candidatus Binatia bacterium]